MIDDILYYISNREEDLLIRLCIPEHLKLFVMHQYHGDLGHMGVDKVYDHIRLKYYWRNLYKNIDEYISRCVTCQQQASQNARASVEIPDIPPYPWAKVAANVSDLYPLSCSSNR